jgi:hypothetical protein
MVLGTTAGAGLSDRGLAPLSGETLRSGGAIILGATVGEDLSDRVLGLLKGKLLRSGG